MTFNDHIQKSISEKITCIWLHPRERIISGWTTGSAPTYSITTSNFVVSITEDSTELAQASSSILNSGEWFYDSSTSILYVRTTLDADPDSVFITTTYRLFYSNKPIILPFDLSTGRDVEYEGILKGTSKFKQQIDSDDLTGISISGTGKISLENNGSVFGEIFDKLSWDNSNVEIYSYSESGTQIIYRGFITSKSYSESIVSFRIKDLIEKLREEVPLDVFASVDGTFPDTLLNTPKRRIYGKVSGLRPICVDQVIDNFELDGTIAGTISGTTITGTTTTFLQDVFQDDIIIFTIDEVEFTYGVTEILSDTSLTISEELDQTFTGVTASIEPNLPVTRNYNSDWLVASHICANPEMTVQTGIDYNRFSVTDITDLEDFEAGDSIYIGLAPTEYGTIRRISGSEVVLNTNLNRVLDPAEFVFKSPINNVYVENQKLTENVHFTVVNTVPNGCHITIISGAEVNIVKPLAVAENVQFLNADRNVTMTSGIIDRYDLHARDWIKPDGTSTYFQISYIESDTSLYLTSNFTGSPVNTSSTYKRPNYIDGNTKITCDVIGKVDANSRWIKTGAGVVEDLLIEAGLEDQLVTANFTSAKEEAPYLIGIALPFNLNGRFPIVRDVINRINESVFGSLFYNSDYEIDYFVLTPKKPAIDEIIRDDDIYNYSVTSTGNNVAYTIDTKYNFLDYNRLNGEENSSYALVNNNDIVKNLNNVKRKENVNLYLFKESDATIIMQRYALLREVANIILKMNTPIKYITKSLNDTMYFELDRIFTRFGTNVDENLIGRVSSIEKDGDSVSLNITDLSGMYNKVCIICDNSTGDYSVSTKIERAISGYITDENGIIIDNYTYRTNLVG